MTHGMTPLHPRLTGRALNRLEPKKPTLVKLLHNVLPVGIRVHKYSAKYEECCPSCDCDKETEEHLYLCPHPDRTLWRNSCKRTVTTKLSKANTEPDLLELAVDGLNALFDQVTLDPGLYPPKCTALIVSQNEIGWDNFLCGRLAKQWADIQDIHLHSKNLKTSRKTGVTWATDLAHLLLQQWLDLWKLRNEARHGKDKQAQREKKQAQLLREVDLVYQSADEIPMDLLPKVFTMSYKRRLEKSHASTQAWLANCMPVLERAKKDRRRRGHTSG